MQKILFQTALLASALQSGAGLQIDSSDETDNVDVLQTITGAIQENTAELKAQGQEDCDELGGTDSDALEFNEYSNESHILKHALWVETSFIPRQTCLAKQGKLTWVENFI